MAQRVLKSANQPNMSFPLSGYASSTIQPMVIDFKKNRVRMLSTRALYIGYGALASFFVTSLLALFLLGEQMNQLWREAQRAPERTIQIVKEAEPEAAFPAATITPLPSKALIIGRDFQQPKTAPKERVPQPLAPMLAQLPLYEKPAAKSGSHFIEVETVSAARKASTLLQQADAAIAHGNAQKAVQLYGRAVQLNPADDGLRSNYVALLLQQARGYDEQGETDKALAVYKKAQGLWQGDSQTAQSIKARIAYLEDN